MAAVRPVSLSLWAMGGAAILALAWAVADLAHTEALQKRAAAPPVTALR